MRKKRLFIDWNRYGQKQGVTIKNTSTAIGNFNSYIHLV